MELFLDPDGRLPPGARLQPTRTVAEELGGARSTVTGAYARLTAEGYVEGRRGGGSIVVGGLPSRRVPDRDDTALTPTPEAAAVRRYGSDPTMRARYDISAGRVDSGSAPVRPVIPQNLAKALVSSTGPSPA
jgi:GntR family transcriptional regulator/MocR family aminotransferase